MMFRRRFVLGAGIGAAVLPGSIWAQTRTLRVLVGFPPGGGTDAIARLLAERLKDELPGAAVVVENKAGGGASIGAGYVAKAGAELSGFPQRTLKQIRLMQFLPVACTYAWRTCRLAKHFCSPS